MRKSVFVLILISMASTSWAQKKKKGDKQEPAKQEAATQPAVSQAKAKPDSVPKDTVPSQFNPLTRHYAFKYSLALQWGDGEVAKDALYDLIVENQGNDSIIYDLAIYYYQNQKYAPAVLVSQELLKRNPKNTAALEISAVGYENLASLERALQSYESLYLLLNNSAVLYKMSYLQLRLKRYKESSTSIDILMADKAADSLKVSYSDGTNNPKEYPMKVALLNLKGMLAQEQGDKVSAKKFYDQALAQAPDFTPAKDNLAKLK
jgi:tetratricopeptide (TPR) repeat protein